MPAVISTRPVRMIVLYLPVRETRMPEMIELPIRPMSSGKIW